MSSALPKRLKDSLAIRPEIQITHTRGGRQSLALVDINTQETAMIRKLESKPFQFFFRDHLRSTLGITCGRGSFAVQDHLRSILGITCGLGIICGRGSLAALYITIFGRRLYKNLQDTFSHNLCKNSNINVIL